MTKSYSVEKAGTVSVPYYSSCRVLLSAIGFVGCMTIYMLRVNLSLSIVCMTEDDEDDDVQNDTSTQEATTNSPAAESPSQYGEFDWSRELQGFILSAFYWGYILTQVVGGWLARRYGARIVVVTGVFISAIATFLSAPFARLSAYGLMAMRFINGLAQGVYYPASFHMWSAWAPPLERSKLMTGFLSGAPIGSVVTYALTGYICEYLGWPWTFHLYGFVAVAYCAWWLYCVYSSPAEHPRITPEEQEYIESSLKGSLASNVKLKTPWKRLCSSLPAQAIFIADFCRAWGAYVNLSSLPQYMSDIFEVDVTTNGLVNSLPHLFNCIFTIVFGQLADYILRRNLLRVGPTRKLMETIGLVPSAIFFIATGYLNSDQLAVAVTFLCLVEGFSAATRAGHTTNMVDIAPRYAGMIMGVSNTGANVAGALAPIVVAAITTDGTQEQWQIVFWLTACMYLFGWIVFMVLGSGEVQPWGLDPEDRVALDVSETSRGQEEMGQPDWKQPEKDQQDKAERVDVSRDATSK